MRPADPCDGLTGTAVDLCKNGGGSGGGSSTTPTDTLDPLSNLAHEMAKAAAWTANQLGKTITSPNTVDLTNRGFLQQYALVFAASTVLVLVLWLLAVAKRAVRGVPMTEAIGEAIGLLWLAVGATAFTPLVLYALIGATHAVTTVLVDATGSDAGGLFTQLGDDLTSGRVGGGPLILAVASLATIVLCGALWLLLVLRALAIYVGALLGVVVYGGLVDRDWWGHVRRWAGFMISVILAEPIIVIVLGLASALQASDSHGAVVIGLAITVLTLGVAVMLIWRVPGWGDAIKVARMTARGTSRAAGIVTGGGSASAGVMRGIEAHGGRSGSAGRASSTGGGGATSTSGTVAGGMSAHSSRTSRPANNTPKPKKKDN